MADARRVALDKTQTVRWPRKWVFFCTTFASALCALGAPAFFYFDHIAASKAERAGGIDFSSLATVVPIDESEWRVQGLSSRLKVDKIPNDLPPLTLAATEGMKTNLQITIAKTAPKLSDLVAKHAAKLRHHLEQGLSSDPVAEAKVASVGTEAPAAIANNPAPSILSASLQSVESKVAKASNGLNGRVSADRSSGKRGALSGLVH
jgi:hypothetical protein